MAGIVTYEIAPPSDRAFELGKFVASASGDASLAGPVSEKDFGLFVSRVIGALDAVARSSSDDDFEGACTLLFSFVKLVPEGEAAGIVDRICAAVAGIGAGKSALVKLRVLTNLYNVLEEKSLKLSVLMIVIRTAADAKQLDVLGPFLAGAGTWQSRWGMSDADARRLYLLVSQVLGAVGEVDQSQAFLIRYLTTFERGSVADVDADARERAKEAAIGYVKAPLLSTRSNLPQLKAVQALRDDPRYAKLHELVSIFSHQSLDAYLAFHAAHSGYVESLGMDHEQGTETMRLLTLCSLAAASPVLSYDDVAKALQVPVSGVEPWVVRAISRGLVDARMDQTAATVTVTRTIQRDFGSTQWTGLQAKLRAWRDNVGSLLASME